MPSAISKRSKNRFVSRRSSTANRPQPTTPIIIQEISLDGTVVSIVFNQAVILKGIPQYVNQADGLPTAAEMTAPNTLALTYAVATTELSIPYEEPAVRNTCGGFVATSTIGIA